VSRALLILNVLRVWRVFVNLTVVKNALCLLVKFRERLFQMMAMSTPLAVLYAADAQMLDWAVLTLVLLLPFHVNLESNKSRILHYLVSAVQVSAVCQHPRLYFNHRLASLLLLNTMSTVLHTILI
jgi:hypothetical protein